MIPCDRLIISDSLLPFHNRYIKVNVAPQKGRPDVPIWQICRSKFESAWKLWNRPSSQQGNNFLHEKYGRRRYWRYSLEIWPGRHFCAEFIQFWTCWMGRDAGYVLHLKTNLIQHLQNLRDICKSLCLQIGVLLYNFIFELVYLWGSVCVCDRTGNRLGTYWLSRGIHTWLSQTTLFPANISFQFFFLENTRQLQIQIFWK